MEREEHRLRAVGSEPSSRVLRRMWLYGGIVAAALSAAAALTYELSPWPRVWMLRLISENEADPVATTTPYVPDDIDARLDLVYDPAEPACRFDVYRPRGAGPLPTVLWVHGGGFVQGRKERRRPYLEVLSSHGFTVIGLEYTTAPEAVYPAQIHQLRRAVRYVVEHAADLGVDPGRLVLGADSAGAHMLAQSVLASTDADYAAWTGLPRVVDPGRLRGAVLASGTYDMRASYAIRAVYGLYAWYVRTIVWAYTGTRRFPSDPRFEQATIVDHVTRSFPPSFISSAPQDPLGPQSRDLARRLRAAGVQVDEVVLDEDSPSGHVFEFDLSNPDARTTMIRLVAFLRHVTGADHRDGVSDGWQAAHP
ncbi:alpha/beta hydrolase [Pseudactinotalea sp. HY158]|uniref:alpha/beta hydrolase n=1 Tax=Pseudactinotalea sp. HY158 TaxID=2654547 RepID=UPI00129C423C|nr:alpha/beta hydrolase [Pseudactinotalea sp. HY158]QGH69656.1 alpha/beta hydrolase fold domain-containing protein [Pseudactinotalea sp. HY158]